MQDGEGVAHVVGLRATDDLEPHAFVEASRLLVLLVDVEFRGTAGTRGVIQQAGSRPITPRFRMHEKHLDGVPVYPDEAEQRPLSILGDGQVRDALYGLRHIAGYMCQGDVYVSRGRG